MAEKYIPYDGTASPGDFQDGAIIDSTHFTNEFDQLGLAFGTGGHNHDGTAGSGPKIGSGGIVTSDTYDMAGLVVDSLTITSGTAVTSIDTDLSAVSATDNTLASAKAIKTYVDAQVTASDLDFQGDSGGALSIDLDSETLTIAGGTGLTTTGSGNTLTVDIDSTVATLTGTQTLTNKTLTSPDINTPDIDGGAIDGTIIGGTTAAAGSFTTVSTTGNITVGGTVDGRDIATDGTKLDGIETGATADQTAAEIRSLVDSATDSNVFTDADHTKLDGIEAGADVTDSTNVQAAGALMDSEVTNLAQVKAFSSADYATAAQGTTADSALQPNDNISELTNDSGFISGNQTITLSGDATGSGTTAITVALASDTVGVNELNLTDGTAGQFLKTDGAGTISFADAPTQQTTFSTIDVTGNATIGGNLTVDGTNTTLNTFGLRVGDNLIALNLNEGPVLNGSDAGIFIERFGSGNNAIFIWDESLDKFAVGTTTSVDSATGNIFYSTADFIANNITANDLDVDNLQLDGNTISSTNANGNIILDPNGTGSVTLESDIKVAGYEPSTRYDTNNDGAVNSSDNAAYNHFVLGNSGGAFIEDGMIIDAPWVGDTNAGNDNCKFGASIIQGNINDVLSVQVGLTPVGHGDTIAFGNIQHNSDGTAKLVNGFSIAGNSLNLGSALVGANTTISGSLSKSSGSFKIDHPLSAKENTHYLVHSFVESPQADNIYRGKVNLVDGSASVNIDTVAGMTEGTFVALNREVQCFTSNESDWDAVKGSVSGNILTISCENTSSTATISWLVVGERKDQHMYDTGWTDENGKVIVEPAKGS